MSAMNSIRTTIQNYFIRLNTGARSPQPRPFELPQEPQRNKPVIINILLFLITFVTTIFAGGGSIDKTFMDFIKSGLPYSITLISILLGHELGHYFAARRFGVKATLPYFIPFPSAIDMSGNIFGIGTMGAIIKTRSPINSRRALFYIGAMGPIIGFILSLAAIIIGMKTSQIRPIPEIKAEYIIPVFGDSLLFSAIIRIFHGTIPAGHDILLSPYAWAGWIGFLVTSLNLMPIGQLDGGHILHALIGNKQRYAGWAAFIGLAFLSFFWHGWALWIAMTLFILMVAHPDVPEGEPLSTGEKILGWLCMLIFLLTFIPVPVQFISS